MAQLSGSPGGQGLPARVTQRPRAGALPTSEERMEKDLEGSGVSQ